MRVYCNRCGTTYNDVYRLTICPHNQFEASPDARQALAALGIPPDEPASERPTQLQHLLGVNQPEVEGE